MSPVEGCTHRVQHHHGTAAAYRVCCSCPDCTWARSLQGKRRRAEGRTHVPLWPVRAHIAMLLSYGMTRHEISVRSGLSHAAVHYVTNHATTYVRSTTAEAILAVRPTSHAVGAMRRVQALVALGWTYAQIGERVGVTAGAMYAHAMGRYSRLGRETYDQVVGAYEDMWQGPEQPNPRSLRTARRRGWVPPMAWDDIDDPTTQPAEGWERRPETSWTPRSETAEDALELLGQGCIPETICARLGKSPAAVAKALARTGHDASEFWALDGQRARQRGAA